MHDVVQLRLLLNRFLVLMCILLEPCSHSKNAVACLAAQIFAGVDAGLIDAGGLFEIVEHVLAGEGESVLDGLAQFCLFKSLVCGGECGLEVKVLFCGVCMGVVLRFLKRRSSYFW